MFLIEWVRFNRKTFSFNKFRCFFSMSSLSLPLMLHRFFSHHHHLDPIQTRYLVTHLNLVCCRIKFHFSRNPFRKYALDRSGYILVFFRRSLCMYGWVLWSLFVVLETMFRWRYANLLHPWRRKKIQSEIPLKTIFITIYILTRFCLY